MKLAGFLVGAGVAGIGVFAFNQWRHVSDEDLLMSALRDHCLPYVLNAETPFADMGRPVGVYDNDLVDDRLQNGGAAIVFDGRFVASWGAITADQTLTVCRIDGRPSGASRHALIIDADGFLDRITQAAASLGDLRSDVNSLAPASDADAMFQTISWVISGDPIYGGNRVVMSVVQSGVANMIVVRDLTE